MPETKTETTFSHQHPPKMVDYTFLLCDQHPDDDIRVIISRDLPSRLARKYGGCPVNFPCPWNHQGQQNHQITKKHQGQQSHSHYVTESP